MINLEGKFLKPNAERAVEYYVRGAAKNNAFCYFELSRLYSEGEIFDKDSYLQGLYLKRAAEEGFVAAQHNLGLAYH